MAGEECGAAGSYMVRFVAKVKCALCGVEVLVSFVCRKCGVCLCEGCLAEHGAGEQNELGV